MTNSKLLERVVQGTVNGDKEAVQKAVSKALDASMEPDDVIDKGLSKGIAIVGDRFEKGEIFLTEMIFAAEAMKEGMAILLPLISKEKLKEKMLGTIIIGTVKGDIHDIGKNIVATYLRVAGFNVHDLGIDVPPLRFIEKAKEVNADIIAMSSLLTSTQFYQKDVITYLEDIGDRERFKVIVGGGAVTPDWTRHIKADGFGKSASDTVELCKKLLSKGSNTPKEKPQPNG